MTPSQGVLLRLQMAFTYLRHSARALFSPSEFLQSARPSWFEAGRQQDCSEFLRYSTVHFSELE